MDKQLLQALDNLSVALETISDTLSKKGAQSPTAKAMQGGNFGNQLKEISTGIKKLQADNQKILKNQNTILEMSKKKGADTKTDALGGAGDKKQESNIKKGAGSILLIAVAVLAIGLAFKIVGKVDFLSVIALALSITLISIAFEKIAKLKISTKEAYDTSIVMVLMAGAIAISSMILAFVMPIGLGQAVTAILISGVFTVLSYGLKNIMTGMKGLKMDDMAKAIIYLPLIFLALSTAVMLSSKILAFVTPIGLGQAVTAILIAGAFAVMSYGLKKIMDGLKGLKMNELAKATIYLPLVFLALSTAIMLSSKILAFITPIGFGQAVTAILIAGVFTILAYGLKKIMDGLKGVKMNELSKTIIFLPLIFLALSTALMLSSYVLALTQPIPFMQLLSILMLSVTLAIATVVMGLAVYVLNKLGTPANYASGGLSIVIIATAIMISSFILNKGIYNNYPDWKWSLGVGLSLLAFGISMAALGALAMTGIGALAIGAGAAMVLLVATTIVGTSYILSTGKYGKYPTLDWSLGTGLSLLAFGTAMVGIGTFILGSLGLGYLALEAGSSAMLMISETIVKSAEILSKGKYTGGPTKSWAEGIAISLGAFMPVYGMLMANKLMSFFGGGVGPKEFSEAIKTVASGIVTAGIYFSTAPGIWKNGPTKEWAEGVGTAIGAFAPALDFISKNSGVFSNGTDVLLQGISAVSAGIVGSAKYFNDNIAVFDVSKVPSKTWAESVGGAIQAFIPALDFISKNSGIFSNGTDMLLNGIKSVSMGIMTSSFLISAGKYDKPIPDGWIKGMSGNVRAYIELAKFVNSSYKDNKKGGLVGAVQGLLYGADSTKDPMERVIDGMVKLSNAYSKLSSSIKNFGNSINGIDIDKLSAVKSFTSNVVLMSLMDADMFDSMLDKLEAKAGIFVDTINSIDGGNEAKKPSNVKSASFDKSQPDPNQQKILQVLSEMDRKLGTIAKNSGTLAEYANELRTSSGIKIKK